VARPLSAGRAHLVPIDESRETDTVVANGLLRFGYLRKHLLMTEPVTDIPRLG
jgi:hypothetical protein